MAKRPGLLYNLGAFVGGVARGLKNPAKPTPPSRVVARRVAEQPVQTPQGPLVLRRTVIDEVVVPEGLPTGAGKPAADPTEGRPG